MKGKGITMDKDNGEPATGGFAYCQWRLYKQFLENMIGLIKYSRY